MASMCNGTQGRKWVAMFVLSSVLSLKEGWAWSLSVVSNVHRHSREAGSRGGGVLPCPSRNVWFRFTAITLYQANAS